MKYGLIPVATIHTARTGEFAQARPILFFFPGNLTFKIIRNRDQERLEHRAVAFDVLLYICSDFPKVTWTNR